jgi:glycosyltransferase involved in cell wall biosynthesis
VIASVIIVAHDRRQFLRAAIESVLSQDLDRPLYELVVVKNFLDPGIDSFLDDAGAKRILCFDKPQNLKIAEGLRACQGRIVLLLDDDDLFESNKLRTVLSEFQTHPTLGFYHNQFTYVGPNGDPLENDRLRAFGLRPTKKARRIYLEANATSTQLSRLAYSYADFNSSSLAIRRDVVVKCLPYLLRVDGAVDTFLFFAALLSPYSLLIDDRVLTRYRVHTENISLAGGADRKARRARLLESATRHRHESLLTREMVLESRNSAVLREIDARILINRLTTIYRDSQSDRLDAILTLIQGLRLRQTSAVKENIPSVAGALLFAFAPRVARAVYEYQVSVR